jgi:hypothetical protein
MLILEYRDYAEYQETIDKIDEGLLASIGNVIGGLFKKLFGNSYYTKMDELIGPKILDEAIDPKSGGLSGKLVSAEQLADRNTPIADVFNDIRSKVKTGAYFLAMLKAVESIIDIDDKIHSLNIAKNQVAKETEDTDANSTKAESLEALRKRGEQAQLSLVALNRKMKETTAAAANELMQKAGDKNKTVVKADIQRRMSNAETLSLLIEYEIKKRRFDIKELNDVNKSMIDAYKRSLEATKNLELEVKKISTDTKAKDGAKNAELDAKAKVLAKYKINDKVKYEGKTGKVLDYSVSGTGKDTIQITPFNKRMGGPQEIPYSLFLEMVRK